MREDIELEYGKIQNEDIEIELLLLAIQRKYGYDFRNYTQAHIKRRVKFHISKGYKNILELVESIITNPMAMRKLLLDLSVNVTEMFRDPEFFTSFKEHIIPILKTYPHIKIWHAGCSSGEEVYSTAILLHEEGLLKKTRLYATDFNSKIVAKARKGEFSEVLFEKYKQNYIDYGGKLNFNSYFTKKEQTYHVDETLKKNIVFAEHNLVNDESFAEVNVVMCRNVLIYFDDELQNKVLDLFNRSLSTRGFLCLGSKEAIRFSSIASSFEAIDERWRLFKKLI